MYVNPQELYAMRLAENVRQKCVEKSIITKDKLILQLKDLKNILEFYGGKLLESDDSEYRISKLNEKNYDFAIYYALDKLTEYDKIDSLKVLTGLGEVFLDYDNLSNIKNDIINTNLGTTLSHSETFSRTFIKPEQLFIKQTIENSYNGKINVTDVAKSFEVSEIEVVARANQLKLF